MCGASFFELFIAVLGLIQYGFLILSGYNGEKSEICDCCGVFFSCILLLGLIILNGIVCVRKNE